MPLPDSFGLVGPVPNINVDEIYVAHFRLSHDAPDRGSAPTLRLRAQTPVNIMYHQWYYRNFPDGGGFFDDALLNPFTPDPSVEKTYSLYWSPNNWTPNFDNLEADILSNGNISDMRSYSLSFDTIDESDTQQGTWTATYVEVGAADRPASETIDLTLADLTIGGPLSPATFENAGNASMSVLNDTPASGMITIDDPGVDLTPPGEDPPNWMIVVYADTKSWDDTVYRATTRMSYPTAADRTNAHRMRVRHNTTVFQLNYEFWLNQNLNGNPYNNPGMPIVSDGDPAVYTPYEVYVDGNGGATSLLDDLFGDGTTDWGNWSLALDQLHQVPAGGQEEAATQTSFHAVLYETLGVLGL